MPFPNQVPPIAINSENPPTVILSKDWLEALADWAEKISLDAQALAAQSRKLLDAMEPKLPKPPAKSAPTKKA
jgi:hypothetical protein